MKTKTHLRELMKNDLMRVYRTLNEESVYSNQVECYRAVVMHEAPRFYVDIRWAHQRIAPMLRGDRSRLEKMKGLMRSQYEDLFDVVLRLSQEEKFCGTSLYYILRHAVQEPAPRFYISPHRMGQIWRENRRRLKTKKLKD